MAHAYRFYCRFALVLFVLNTIYPVTVKLLQDRLAGDWLHSVLHFISSLLAAYALWQFPWIIPAKLYTWGIGLLYFALGTYGWFTSGLFLDTPFAIPLGPADNIFHLLLSAPALVIAAIDVRTRFFGAGRSKEAVKQGH